MIIESKDGKLGFCKTCRYVFVNWEGMCWCPGCNASGNDYIEPIIFSSENEDLKEWKHCGKMT